MPRGSIDHVVDAERDFVITPERMKFFVRTGKQVIAACNTQMRINRWLEVYRAMLGHVRDFAEQHADRLNACYAFPRGTKTMLSFVPRSDAFDFELAPELAELQFSLSEIFPILGSIEVGQIPHWDVDRFVEFDRAEQLFPSESEGPVDAST